MSSYNSGNQSLFFIDINQINRNERPIHILKQIAHIDKLYLDFYIEYEESSHKNKEFLRGLLNAVDETLNPLMSDVHQNIQK